MQAATLSGGFSDPALQSAHAFRAVMEAMARPGTVVDIAGAAPPAPLSGAAGAVLLTLCDADTPVHLAGSSDTDDLRAWIAFHTGAPLVGPSHAMFALGSWDALLPLSAYPVGTPDYPDRSATLIVEVDSLDGAGAILTGPGIRDKASLALPDTGAFQANAALFPMGLDFILTCGNRLAALPRTTTVTSPESA